MKKIKRQLYKVSTRSLIENFGQTEDKHAPLLKVDGTALTLAPCNPKKDSHLLFDASVYKYYTGYNSAGLTGSGTSSGGRGIRKGTEHDRRQHEAALRATLTEFGSCGTKKKANEVLKEKALTVSYMCVFVCECVCV